MGSASGLSSARSVGSARYVTKPEVGKAAMYSALGSVRPLWEKGPTASAGGSGRSSAMPAAPREPDTRPYHVARARARRMLKHALATSDGTAQLRRLEMAMQLPAAK